jgi:hypothetical protein
MEAAQAKHILQLCPTTVFLLQNPKEGKPQLTQRCNVAATALRLTKIFILFTAGDELTALTVTK